MRMKTAWIIDGSYMNLGAKAAGIKIDILNLKRRLEREVNGGEPISRGHYVNATPPDYLSDAMQRFHKYLKSAEPTGPQLRVDLYEHKKQTQICPSCKTKYSRNVQKGVDVRIATQIVSLSEEFEQIVLLAGDCDFLDAIKVVKGKSNKRLVIAGFRGTVSTDLQSYADSVIWLDDWAATIGRTS